MHQFAIKLTVLINIFSLLEVHTSLLQAKNFSETSPLPFLVFNPDIVGGRPINSINDTSLRPTISAQKITTPPPLPTATTVSAAGRVTLSAHETINKVTSRANVTVNLNSPVIVQNSTNNRRHPASGSLTSQSLKAQLAKKVDRVKIKNQPSQNDNQTVSTMNSRQKQRAPSGSNSTSSQFIGPKAKPLASPKNTSEPNNNNNVTSRGSYTNNGKITLATQLPPEIGFVTDSPIINASTIVSHAVNIGGGNNKKASLTLASTQAVSSVEAEINANHHHESTHATQFVTTSAPSPHSGYSGHSSHSGHSAHSHMSEAIGGKTGQPMQHYQVKHLLNVTLDYPLADSDLIYGYVIPMMTVVTLVTNTLIVIVLSRPDMRTPTNIVVMAIAITDVIIMIIPAPWYVYLFAMGNKDEILYPPLVCYAYQHSTRSVSEVFYFLSTWLNLLLAVQDYLSLCWPKLAQKYCQLRAVIIQTIVLTLVAIMLNLPQMLKQLYKPVVFWYNGQLKHGCRAVQAKWFKNLIGHNAALYDDIFTAFIVLLVDGGSSIALIVITWLLIRHLYQQKREGHRLMERARTASSRRKEKQRQEESEASAKVLIFVLVAFLGAKIPFTTIYSLLIIQSRCKITIFENLNDFQKPIAYTDLVFILSYPVNFTIFCCCSKKFRHKCLELFTQCMEKKKNFVDSTKRFRKSITKIQCLPDYNNNRNNRSDSGNGSTCSSSGNNNNGKLICDRKLPPGVSYNADEDRDHHYYNEQLDQQALAKRMDHHHHHHLDDPLSKSHKYSVTFDGAPHKHKSGGHFHSFSFNLGKLASNRSRSMVGPTDVKRDGRQHQVHNDNDDQLDHFELFKSLYNSQVKIQAENAATQAANNNNRISTCSGPIITTTSYDISRDNTPSSTVSGTPQLTNGNSSNNNNHISSSNNNIDNSIGINRNNNNKIGQSSNSLATGTGAHISTYDNNIDNDRRNTFTHLYDSTTTANNISPVNSNHHQQSDSTSTSRSNLANRPSTTTASEGGLTIYSGGRGKGRGSQSRKAIAKSAGASPSISHHEHLELSSSKISLLPTATALLADIMKGTLLAPNSELGGAGRQ